MCVGRPQCWLACGSANCALFGGSLNGNPTRCMDYEIAAWMGLVSSPRWMEMKETKCNFSFSLQLHNFGARAHKSQFIQLLFMKTKFWPAIAIVPFHWKFRSLAADFNSICTTIRILFPFASSPRVKMTFDFDAKRKRFRRCSVSPYGRTTEWPNNKRPPELNAINMQCDLRERRCLLVAACFERSSSAFMWGDLTFARWVIKGDVYGLLDSDFDLCTAVKLEIGGSRAKQSPNDAKTMDRLETPLLCRKYFNSRWLRKHFPKAGIVTSDGSALARESRGIQLNDSFWLSRWQRACSHPKSTLALLSQSCRWDLVDFN